jgi:phage replication O-like protein O
MQMHNPYKDLSKLSPQRENGHRQIENSVFQALIRAGLSSIEYSLVLCVIDKTWGFNKTEDTISLWQFSESTLRDKGNIVRALKSLEKRRIVVIQKSGIGRGKGNIYMLNKYWDTWLPVPEGLKKGVTTTPFTERVSPQHLLDSKGVTTTPFLEPEKGVTLTPLKGVKTALKGVTAAQEKGVTLTPTKESIKKSTKEREKESTLVFGEFKNVKLSPADHQRLVARYGAQGATDWIEELSLAKASKGYKSINDYATILSWERREAKRKRESAPAPQKGGTHGINQRHTEQSRVHTTADLERSIEHFPRSEGLPQV